MRLSKLSIFLFTLALCLMLAVPVMATPLTFQNEHDITDVTLIGGTYCTLSSSGFTRSTTAGNQYVFVSDFCSVQNINAVPFTYAAWTDFTGEYIVTIYLGDSSNTTIATLDGTSLVTPARTEVVITGSTARVYVNGILKSTSGTLSTNPSYVQLKDGYGGSGATSFDDFIMNTAEGTHVVGMPASNGYYIKKDMVNPANSGIFNYTTGALVNSNYMYTTWGRSNVSAVGGNDINESMYLQKVNTGVTYEEHYTGNATAGTTTWNIASSLIAGGAPYGLYRVRFGTFDSDTIAYIANGANVAFDKSNYNQNDVATITYLIDASYWDTSTYTYALKVYRVNDWVVVQNTPITSTSGTVLYQFTSSDTQGTYYAVITATPNAGGNEIWMAFNWAQMTAYFAPYGYVNNQGGSVISGANVSLSQGSIISNTITTASGNYTGSGFTGAVMTINVTAAGYHQYLATLTPMVTGSKYINITLNSTSPACAGLCIGGVHRDGILTGTAITSGYGRPIGGATTHVKNTTFGDYCTNVSNMAGWYIVDEGNGCVLTTGRLYDVWSEKLGYSNSPNYTAVTA